MTSILDFQPEPREASNKRAKSIVAAVYDFDLRAGDFLANVVTPEELEQRLVVASEDVAEVAQDHGLEPELLTAALAKRWEDEREAEAKRAEAKAAKVRRLARRKTATVECPNCGAGRGQEDEEGGIRPSLQSETAWKCEDCGWEGDLPKQATKKEAVEWYHPDPDGMAEEVDGRNEQDVAEMLMSVLYEANEFDLTGVTTFENEGVLSGNEGIVLRFADGSEFQVTIVQSR